jgi:tetratricopeptide (TPR) repeat protein
MATESNSDVVSLAGRRVAFAGKLGGATKRDAQHIVRQHGGTPLDKPMAEADLIVVGADELPLSGIEELLDEPTRQAIAAGRVEMIGEAQLWQQLGLAENEAPVRLYTPAMLADLLGVSVATIRRWHRRGLIVPAREVLRLPYFDFQEVATARRLGELLAAGMSAAEIERNLAGLSRFLPGVERPLAQLSVIVEGRQLLLRQGEGLIEPGGQLRIDFDALEKRTAEPQEATREATLSFEDYVAARESPLPVEDVLQLAEDYEDQGQLEAAVEMCRVALSAGGPKADTCFQLAELLYRLGDITAARERYYMAVELDEDLVEARANLGCVLAELGQRDLAISAFQGALKYHQDYPDVHYHLARTLDELGRSSEATTHWRRFLELAPDSPWADEADARLAESR